MKELARGAEAIIYHTEEGILKERPPKTYRHPQLDATLRKTRTRKEAKILEQLQQLGIPAPRLLNKDEQQGTITMTFIKGIQLKEVLDTNPQQAEHVGRHLTTLHDNNIIHGDLTTSNLILQEDGTIALIDFGLTTHSTRIEDKAVDLHLFKQALKSKHPQVEHKAWRSFLKGYQPKEREEILKRLIIVERRGRNKA